MSQRPESHRRERVFAGTGVFWGLIVGVLFAAAVIVLAAQNAGSVRVRWLVWDFSAPLAAVILGAALVAVVVDQLASLYVRRRRRRALAELDRLRSTTQEPDDRP